MKVSDKNVSKSISIILLLIGVAVLFTSELLWLNIAGALLMAVGLWGLIR